MEIDKRTIKDLQEKLNKDNFATLLDIEKEDIKDGTLTIPKEVEFIPKELKSKIKELGITKINFEKDSQLLTIDEKCFEECNELEYITFENCSRLEQLQNFTFRGCQHLKNVSFNNCSSLKSLGQNCFTNCKSIESYNFENCTSLTQIDEFAFSNNTKLKHFDFSQLKNLQNIKNGAFANCENLEICNFSQNDKLETIQPYAFGFTKSLKEIIFPKNTKKSLSNITLCSYAFNHCAIENLDLENTNVEQIKPQAFINCTQLKTINLLGCKSFANTHNIFQNCKGIKTIDCRNTNINTKFLSELPKLQEVKISSNFHDFDEIYFKQLTNSVIFCVYDNNDKVILRFNSLDKNFADYRIGTIDILAEMQKNNTKVPLVIANSIRDVDSLKIVIKNKHNISQIAEQVFGNASSNDDTTHNAILLLSLLGYFGFEKPTNKQKLDSNLISYKNLLAKDFLIHKIQKSNPQYSGEKIASMMKKEIVRAKVQQYQNKLARGETLQFLIHQFLLNNLAQNKETAQKFINECKLANLNSTTAKIEMAQFIVNNFDKILDNKIATLDINEPHDEKIPICKDGTLRFYKILQNFGQVYTQSNKEIISRKINQRLNLEDFEQCKNYTNIHSGNEKLAILCANCCMSEEQFEQAQNIFETGKKIANKQVLEICKDIDTDIHYEFIGKDNPLSIVLGNITNCCQRIGGVGEECMKTGATNEKSGFVVFKHKDNIIGQSWVWYDDKSKTIALDNIEVPDIYNKFVNKEKSKEVSDCIERTCTNFLFTMRHKGYDVENVIIGHSSSDIQNLQDNYHKEQNVTNIIHCPFQKNGEPIYSDVSKSGQFVVYRGGKRIEKNTKLDLETELKKLSNPEQTK